MRYNFINSANSRMGRLISFLILCPLLLVVGRSHAEIYTWKDAQGRSHFGDRPPAESQATQLQLRINTYTNPEIQALNQPLSSSDHRQVVMYSTSWCGVCKKAKRYFRKKKIPFQEYDVEKSRKGKSDFRRLGGRGVPIILVGDQRMNGFTAGRFDSFYRQK